MSAELLNHRFFNLKLHSDAELQTILGCTIAERRTVHEWPLSCVQVVTTSSGDRWIYKSAYGPTVEDRFYQRAVSPLLPKARCLYRRRGTSILLIDYIQGTLVGDLHCSRDELLAIGRSLVDQISRIRGNVPCYRDLGSVRCWQGFVARVLADLARLIDSAAFRLTTREDVAYLREWASRRTVLGQFTTRARTIHGDAIRDNVFVTPGGLKLIDWQRPIRAPAEIDIVSLLESMDFSPIGSVDPAVIGIFHFTRLAWAVECQITWIPDGTCYDSWVSDQTRKIIEACGG